MKQSLAYQPALDGVRAFAVAMVLLFHQGFAWMSGGYVGVSVFFTLSGYLITSLLVVEHRDHGSISLGRFYTRRARRLLPAGLVCLCLIVAARTVGEFENVPHLRRDLLGSLFQVQNWVKLSGTASYTDLLNASTGERGPLEHYWSLAIEEQFYWLWPLIVLVGFGLVRSWKRRRVMITALAVLAGAAAPFVAVVWGADATYWATPARAGEILIGAALAIWQRGRPVDVVTNRVRRLPWLAVVALAAIVVVGVTWPAAGGPAYHGYLPLFAVGSAALIAGLQAPSALRTVLSVAPLVWLGRISYGVYLFHWPVFVLLTERRTGVAGLALFGLRVAVTLVLATVSFVLVERPIRNARPQGTHPFAAQGFVALGAAAVVAVVAVVAVPGTVADFYAPDAAQASAVALDPVSSLAPLLPATTTTVAPSTSGAVTTAVAASTTAEVGTTTAAAVSTTALPSTSALPSTAAEVAPTTSAALSLASLPVPSRPVRILVVGDSTALATGTGLIAWAARHPERAQVSLSWAAGCGFIRNSVIEEDFPFQERCDQLLDQELPAALAALLPDVVVLMVTMRDLENRTWSEEEGELTPFDPRYRQRLLEGERAMAMRLAAAGVEHIAWILPPRPSSPFLPERAHMGDPRRYAVQTGTILQVAGEMPGLVDVVDLDTWMADRNLISDGVIRPDGLHLTPDAALQISEDMLGPAILAAALL